MRTRMGASGGDDFGHDLGQFRWYQGGRGEAFLRVRMGCFAGLFGAVHLPSPSPTVLRKIFELNALGPDLWCERCRLKAASPARSPGWLHGSIIAWVSRVLRVDQVGQVGDTWG